MKPGFFVDFGKNLAPLDLPKHTTKKPFFGLEPGISIKNNVSSQSISSAGDNLSGNGTYEILSDILIH
jgi:hypothetical protein